MLLVLDLGDPLRFHHMLRVFKPSSPMSLGTWSLTVYSLPLTLIVAIEAAQAINLLPPDSIALEWVRRMAVVAGLLPAFGSLAYKGVLFSTSSQPGWKDARWLGGFMANSALMLGCAVMLAVSVLTGHPRAAADLSGPSSWCCFHSTSFQRVYYSQNFTRLCFGSTPTGRFILPWCFSSSEEH